VKNLSPLDDVVLFIAESISLVAIHYNKYTNSTQTTTIIIRNPPVFDAIGWS